ncbi:MAG: outer membrane protein assembly factor BamB family protein [Peptoniphilaceae bacterium]
MEELKTMYKGVANSPESYLKEKVVAESNIIYVANTSIIPEIPNLLVIGDGENAETVLVKNKRSDGGFDVQRGVEGVARTWEKTTTVARNFTNYDYEKLVDNIGLLDGNKVQRDGNKILSDNNYSNVDKEKVDNIPSNPKYTDTTYAPATTSKSGLMSNTDKTKLDGIQVGAEKNTVTSVNGKTGKVNINIPEIINDLTSGGIDKTLSAEQGKVLFQNVDDGKNLVANAIIDKGQSGVSNNSTFTELANKIALIKTGYGVGEIISPNKIKVLSQKWEILGEKNDSSKTYKATIVDDFIYVLEKNSLIKFNKYFLNEQTLFSNQGLGGEFVYDGNNFYIANSDVVKIDKLGNEIWRNSYFKNNNIWIYASAMLPNGNIVFGGYEGKAAIFSPSGSTLIQKQLNGNTVSDFSTDNYNNIFATLSDSKLYKYDSNLNLEWTYNSGLSSTLLDVECFDDFIFVSSKDGYLIKIDKSGREVWKKKVGIGNLTPIQIYDDSIYVNDKTSHKFSKYDLDGELLYEKQLESEQIRGLSISDNVIYLNMYKKLLAIQDEKTIGYEVIK